MLWSCPSAALAMRQSLVTKLLLNLLSAITKFSRHRAQLLGKMLHPKANYV